MEMVAEALASLMSTTLLPYLAKGSRKLNSLESTPKCHPKYLPEVHILKLENSGICTQSHCLTAATSSSERMHPEIMRTHLTLRKRPQALPAILKMEACRLSKYKCLRAEPKSSAHTLVVASAGIHTAY